MTGLPAFSFDNSLWLRIRRPFIAACLTVHFGTGLLCFLRPPCALLEIKPVAKLVDCYKDLDLAQTWRMFAPPSQTKDEVQFAVEMPGGWTSLLPLDHFLVEQGTGRMLLPPGYLRIANHFRHPNFQKQRLQDEIFYYQYFQSMSAFYCFGDGSIPAMKAIRFYSVSRGLAPFYERDGDGHALPKASDYNKVEALYERRC